MTWVFHESDARGYDRLVLLALADEADDEGANAYPSMRRIAAKARVGAGTVPAVLMRLETAGAILVERPPRRGRGAVYRYTVTMGKGSAPERSDEKETRGNVQKRAEPLAKSEQTQDPKPEELKPSSSPSEPKGKRSPNLVWDAIVEVVRWEPKTKGERGRIGKAEREIRGAVPEGAPDDQIAFAVRGRAMRYRREWPNAELTPEALVKHWSRFGPRKAEEEPEPLTGSAAFYEVDEETHREGTRRLEWQVHLRDEARARGETPDYSTPVPDGWTPPERPQRPVGATESDRAARGRRRVPRGFAKRPGGPEEASG